MLFFIIGLVLLLLVWLFANRRRQWLQIPSRCQARRATVLSRAVVRIPLLCWLAIGGLALYALTNPRRTVQTVDVVVERRMFTVCIDTSASMGKDIPGSNLFRVKAATSEFVALREGDVIGLVAYSGTRKRSLGHARILVYPTHDISQVKTAIAVTDAEMFGGTTAIGDGMFVATMSLVRNRIQETMGDEFDRWLLQASVESLGTNEQDLRYAQHVAHAIGPQEGKFIVLFSDGENEIGMNPRNALWFARRIGIRVHFVAYREAKGTPYSPYGAPEPKTMSDKKQKLVTAILETGGTYQESDTMDTIPTLFRMVHEAEKNRVIIQQSERSIDIRYPFYVVMAGLMGLWLISERIWQKVP